MSGTLGPPPAPGWGSPLIAQAGQGAGLLGGAAGGTAGSDDELAKALAQLYSGLGGAPTGGQSLLGNATGAANQIRRAVQQSGAANQAFQDARQQGIQSGYPITQEDRDKVLQQAINGASGAWSGGEGSGGNGGGQR